MQQDTRVPAAQYVRMSTDDQQFSIANQQDAIKQYADEHGFKIVATYSDAGKSGLILQHREGLRRLLRDVTDSHPSYRAILVYDVSRWGRFQDVDEAAHYEFLCKQSGIHVYYCAESFVNDGTLPSAIAKALKRTMAAEYSRELSAKVFAGKCRLASLGYWVSGTPPYGLRRMMVSEKGKLKQIMQQGEEKSLHSHHTVLVHGPQKEVRMVRKIYNMYIDGMGATAIASYLNCKRIRFFTGRWDYSAVLRMLRNPIYVGCNVWHKTSGRLRSHRLRLPKKHWLIKLKAFPPIIDQHTFDRVQRLLVTRIVKHRYSDGELLRKLERLLKRNGRLTRTIINDAPGPFALIYANRFGSLLKAYKLVGYDPPPRSQRISEGWKRASAIRNQLIDTLVSLFPHNLVRTRLPGKLRTVLLMDGSTLISVITCQSYETSRRRASWLLKIVDGARERPVVVCLLNNTNEHIGKIYLLSDLTSIQEGQMRYYFGIDDPFLSSGKVLNDLRHFYAVMSEMVVPCAGLGFGKSLLVQKKGPPSGTHARIQVSA